MDTPRILIVDDEASIRRQLDRLLTAQGYVCTQAADAEEARWHLKEKQFALVLCDVNMPGESGLDLAKHVLLMEFPFTAAVMVTGLDDPAIADVALKNGAYGYIIKPFESNEVLINVANALRRRQLEIEHQSYLDRLEDTVMLRTESLRRKIRQLEQAQDELRLSREETVQRLALAAEFRDNDTARHLQRMSHYCELLARRHGLDAERCELIRIASPMHDIGKIGTPDHILLKPGKFSPDEYAAIMKHAEMGRHILDGSEAELLRLAATIAWTHHEKFDGTGYPRKLAGEQIPLEGRIAAIADTFDALTSPRVYKPAFSLEQTLDILRDNRGKHFDPSLLDTFLGSMDQVLAVKRQFGDPVEGQEPGGHA
jgi:putative two-component system response regulator